MEAETWGKREQGSPIPIMPCGPVLGKGFRARDGNNYGNERPFRQKIGTVGWPQTPHMTYWKKWWRKILSSFSFPPLLLPPSPLSIPRYQRCSSQHSIRRVWSPFDSLNSPHRPTISHQPYYTLYRCPCCPCCPPCCHCWDCSSACARNRSRFCLFSSSM